MNKDTVRLADLCDLVAQSVDPVNGALTTYVGLEHLEPARFTRIGAALSSSVRSQKSSFRRGDVLYGKLRPYLDKAVLAQDDGICTTELLVLRPRSGVDPRFLVGVLHCPDFLDHAVRGTTGAQHPRTSWPHIREFRLLGSVRRDHDAIGDFLWLLHSARETCEGSLDVLVELKRATMRTLFTLGLRNEPQQQTAIGPLPKNWGTVSLGEVFDIEQGLSLKGNLTKNDDGEPFLRTSNVYWGRVVLDTVSRMRLNKPVADSKWLRTGDLLVCEGGEIGRAAVWDGQIERCLFQNHLHRLRPKEDGRVDVAFAAAWLQEGFVHRSVYEGVGNRTTIPNLSRGRLAEMHIPHPSLEEQCEIVAILDALDRKADLHRRKRAVLDDLFKTLLHKLMTGEIQVADLDLPRDLAS